MRCLLLLILFSSCTLRVKTPINRGVSPEAVGSGGMVRFEGTGVVKGRVRIDSVGDLGSSPDLSTSSSTGYTFTWGAARQFDFFTKLIKDLPPLLGVKIQFWGLPQTSVQAGHKLSLTLAFGKASDTFDESLKVDLTSSVKDYSLIHGYRFSESFLLYESVSISKYEFSGVVLNPPITFTKDRFDYETDSVLTLAVGLIFNFSYLDFNLEFASQKSKWNGGGSNTEYSILYSAGLVF